MDILLVGKIISLFIIWAFIAGIIYFVYKSKSFYFQLKEAEVLCNVYRRKFIKEVAPSLGDISKKIKLIYLAKNLKGENLKEFYLSAAGLMKDSFKEMNPIEKLFFGIAGARFTFNLFK